MNKHYSRTLVFFLLSTLLACSTKPLKIETHSQAPKSPFHAITCLEDRERQKARSEELQQIVTADQKDRLVHPVDWSVVSPRDLIRIKRVGEIFAEGCFLTGKDYDAAALVIQHGDHPDHSYQTYLWAKRAVELGTTDHKGLMLAGLDRHLVSRGFKQLFGTQSRRIHDDCRCVEPVETRFTDKLRVEMGSTKLKISMAEALQINNGNQACKGVRFCESKLVSAPLGTLPGVW